MEIEKHEYLLIDHSHVSTYFSLFLTVKLQKCVNDLRINGNINFSYHMSQRLYAILKESTYYNKSYNISSRKYINKLNKIEMVVDSSIPHSDDPNEHCVVINYNTDDKLYIHINRNIQKEREKTINELL